MTHSITRRKLLIGLPLLAGMGVAPALRAADSPFSDIERRHGGRLGVFAIDTGSGRTLSHRADERFLMCSTFKGLLAAQILSRVDSGAERLDRLVHYTEKDLIFTSPVTKANVGELLSYVRARPANDLSFGSAGTGSTWRSPGCVISIGSSAVQILRSGTLMWLSAECSVVVLPEPVGPTHSTMP